MKKERKSEILKFVIEYKRAHNGNSPSYSEIMDFCGITSKSYIKLLLEKIDVIKFNGTRSIEVLGSEWRMLDSDEEKNN